MELYLRKVLGRRDLYEKSLIKIRPPLRVLIRNSNDTHIWWDPCLLQIHLSMLPLEFYISIINNVHVNALMDANLSIF